jgi:hypothetical protein
MIALCVLCVCVCVYLLFINSLQVQPSPNSDCSGAIELQLGAPLVRGFVAVLGNARKCAFYKFRVPQSGSIALKVMTNVTIERGSPVDVRLFSGTCGNMYEGRFCVLLKNC